MMLVFGKKQTKKLNIRGYEQCYTQEGAKEARAPLKGEKIESFVIFTLILIPKSLKIYHFLNENSQFDFLRLKNIIFSKFRPLKTLKPKLQETHFLRSKNTNFFQNFAFTALEILNLTPP